MPWKGVKSYYITDLSEGSGTYIKIEKPLVLKHRYIISYGDSHMLTLLDKGNLEVKFIEGPKNTQNL